MERSEYTGFFAEFYDLLHATAHDAAQYPALLAPYGKKVLEIGCGTGRIAIPLAKAGFSVTGLEYEADMIRILEGKDYPRENLTVAQGDARDFDLAQSFDGVIMGCNFINHFADSYDLLRVLRCCRRHLRPGGLLLIDCSLPDMGYMYTSNGVAEELRFETERGTVIHDSFCPNYDFINQVETDIITLRECRGDALVREAEAVVTLTFYLPREVRALLREAGFTILRERGSLHRDVPISHEYSEMVFIATPRE